MISCLNFSPTLILSLSNSIIRILMKHFRYMFKNLHVGTQLHINIAISISTYRTYITLILLHSKSFACTNVCTIKRKVSHSNRKICKFLTWQGLAVVIATPENLFVRQLLSSTCRRSNRNISSFHELKIHQKALLPAKELKNINFYRHENIHKINKITQTCSKK